MNTKTETPAATKASPDSKAPLPASAASKQMAESISQGATQTGTGNSSNALSPEIIELLTELRDTVKGLNPRKHTAKTLRRALSNVSAILADINELYQQD